MHFLMNGVYRKIIENEKSVHLGDGVADKVKENINEINKITSKYFNEYVGKLLDDNNIHIPL